MKYNNVKRTNYFDPAHYQQLINRLDSLTPAAERRWGQMNVAQMLHHLNLSIGSGLGYYPLPDESNWISRGVGQYLILNVLKKFPKGTQTVTPLRVDEEFDFETEKKQLREILIKAYTTTTDEAWGKHTYFGKMSRQAWGKLILIHCHHHFQQFSH